MILLGFSSFNGFSKLLAVCVVLIACFYPYESSAISSQISIAVNGEAITDGDISKRIAFLKLRKINGDLKKIAKQELIVEALKKQESEAFGIILNPSSMNYFFAQYARNTGISAEEFSDMLEHLEIGENHFKKYLAIQLAWDEIVRNNFIMKYRGLAMEIPPSIKGGEKNLTVREYLVKKIIFSVPYNKHKNEYFIQKRIDEAEKSRFHFPKNCNRVEEFASAMHDVSVSNPQYFLESDLQPQLKILLNKTKNNTTNTFVTEKGVEYIAICNIRDIGGELALKAYFNTQEIPKKIKKYDEEYIKTLRANAIIQFYQ